MCTYNGNVHDKILLMTIKYIITKKIYINSIKTYTKMYFIQYYKTKCILQFYPLTTALQADTARSTDKTKALQADTARSTNKTKALQADTVRSKDVLVVVFPWNRGASTPALHYGRGLFSTDKSRLPV